MPWRCRTQNVNAREQAAINERKIMPANSLWRLSGPRNPQIILRRQSLGALYQVMSRGNARRAIVRDDADRKRWLEWLERTVATYNWRLHAFVLMNNQAAHGLILGSAAFVQRLHALLDARPEQRETPQLRALRAGPALAQVVAAVSAEFAVDPARWRPEAPQRRPQRPWRARVDRRRPHRQRNHPAQVAARALHSRLDEHRLDAVTVGDDRPLERHRRVRLTRHGGTMEILAVRHRDGCGVQDQQADQYGAGDAVRGCSPADNHSIALPAPVRPDHRCPARQQQQRRRGARLPRRRRSLPSVAS